jgi:hypothetical protein
MVGEQDVTWSSSAVRAFVIQGCDLVDFWGSCLHDSRYTSRRMNTYFRVTIPEPLDDGTKNQTFASLRGAREFVQERVFRGPYFIAEVDEQGSPVGTKAAVKTRLAPPACTRAVQDWQTSPASAAFTA